MRTPNQHLSWTWNSDGCILAEAGYPHGDVEIGRMDSADDAEYICDLHNRRIGLCRCGAKALMTKDGTPYCAACAGAKMGEGVLKP